MSSPPLIAQRERRSNAGNRMRALLDIEFEAEEMFAEEEDDKEFVSQADEEDVFESDFASTEEEQEEDEEAEEKAIMREEKANRAAARKKAERTTTTSLFAKKPAGKPSEPRPKAPKRVSIALPPEGGGAPVIVGVGTGGLPMRRRQSARASVQTAKLNLERKLKADAARRASIIAKPKRPKQPRKTQDQLIADALELEERNVKSLKDFLAREEEKKRAARVVRKTVHEGGVVAFISRAEEVKVPLVQVIEPPVIHAIDVQEGVAASLNGVQQEVKVEPSREEPAVERSAHLRGPVSSQLPGTSEEAVIAPSAPPPPQDAMEGDTAPIPVEKLQEEEPHPTDDVAMTSADGPDATIGDPAALRQEGQEQTAELSMVSEAQPLSTPVTEAPLSSIPALEAPMEGIPAEGAQRQPPEVEQQYERFLQTRNLVALKDLILEEAATDDDEEESDAPRKSKNKAPWSWVEDMTALFGNHVDWGSLRVVPSRNRPLYRRPPICPMTGLPAPYRDPSTGIPYANAKAYRTLQRLTRHEYVWSDGRGMYFADEAEQGAKGVPETWNGYVRGTLPLQQRGSDTKEGKDVEMTDA